MMGEYFVNRSVCMRKNKKKNSIILLVLLLLGITLGYSLLSSNLNISGTTGLSNNTWNIHWSNLSVTNGSVTGTQVTTPATIKTGNTEVEYSITLSTPGDFYEFTVDAVNEGSIDAMIESFSNKTYESNGTTEKTLPTYLNYTVTYSDGVALAPKQKLAANSTEKIKVRVEFKRDIEANQLPTTADTIVFKFNVTYVQADNTAIDIDHLFTGTIYRNNSKVLFNGFDIGNENKLYYYKSEEESSFNDALQISYLFKDYNSCKKFFGLGAEECTSENLTITPNDYTTDPMLLNTDVYLKNDVVNNIVTRSYVCFVTDKENCLEVDGKFQREFFNSNKLILQSNETWFENDGGSCYDPNPYFGYGYQCSSNKFPYIYITDYSLDSAIVDSNNLRCRTPSGTIKLDDFRPTYCMSIN